MSANKVLPTESELLKVIQKGNKALALVGEEGRMELISELDKALEAFKDGVLFEVSLLAPKTFTEFLALQNPTQGPFNQLVSELWWEDLLNQVEAACFLKPKNLAKAQPFIEGLWADEVVTENLFKPPAGWRYLPVEEAINAFKKIFGSSIKANSVAERARNLPLWDKGEGVAVWLSLSFLLRYFEIPRILGISESVRPWEDTEDSRVAYAKMVELLIPIAGDSYTKAYPEFSFRNWREGALTANYILLTQAARKAWQELESRGDDDFVVAPANSGFFCVGHSIRRSRVEIISAGNQFGQDCIMVGSTIMVQPDRLTTYKDLGIDCPGNSYSSDAGRRFAYSVYFYWRDRDLRFRYGWVGSAYHGFGSAVGRLG